MNDTTMSKAEQVAQNLFISWAIQDAINAKALRVSTEEAEKLDKLITMLAETLDPAEA